MNRVISVVRRIIVASRTFLAALPWVVQTAILVSIYVAVMAIATQWMPWHLWDMNLFASEDALQTSTFDPKIVVVDVRSYSETDNKSPQRTTIAAFLSKLASKPPSQHPIAVILDFNFGPCTLCRRATAALLKSLSAERAAGIDVYAVEALPVDQNDVPGSLEPHDPDIYDGYRYLAGFGHATFFVADSGVLISRACYAAVPYRAPDSDTRVTQSAQSVIALVLAGFDGGAAQQATLACNTTQRGHVYVGPTVTRFPYSALPRGQFYPITLGHPFPNIQSLKGDYVIVGSVEHDQPILQLPPAVQEAWQRLHGIGSANIGGPELTAWALSDARSAATMRGVQAVNGMLLFLAAAFSGITALAFAACFFLLRRLTLRSTRRFLPWIAAVLACCIGLGIFVAFEFLMLGFNKNQPQVSLVAFAILVSAGLSGVRGNQIEFEQLWSIEDIAPPEKYDYDVFISYAHDEGAWVSEHVYVPFRDAKLSDGRKLAVFFDTETIRGGTAWQSKISLAINASRFVVPIYSDIYFRKPYCRFEINRAFRKWINAGEGSYCVLPVMRGHPKILESVDDIQAVSVDDQPDIVEQYVAEVVVRLSRLTPSAEVRRGEKSNEAGGSFDANGKRSPPQR